ncbi:MAG TPA: S24 family peptidase [Gammaproteobacteria bacterium]|jgi:SOS-response transcriptional repressor LexA|nr:S24 family peptidase [Gammaproteobacteria bacterium]
MDIKKSEATSVTPVSVIIKQLMKESGIIEAELARQTELPQTTINRLLIGETLDPRANTLIPIAKFFGITIGQLVGQEPLNPNRINGVYNPTNKAAWAVVPLIEWHDVSAWIFQKNSVTPATYTQWIISESDIGEGSFALKTLGFMEPRFRKGSTIIVDPHCDYKDGNFVVISLNNAEPTVRRVLKDGADVYLKKLYGSDEPVKKLPGDTIIGTIVETRINEK